MTTEFVCKDLHVSVQGLATLVFALGAMMVLNADMTKRSLYAERMEEEVKEDEAAALGALHGAMVFAFTTTVSAVIDTLQAMDKLSPAQAMDAHEVITRRLRENWPPDEIADPAAIEAIASEFQKRARPVKPLRRKPRPRP